MLQEKNAKDVEIPNIKWDVFELMMRCELHILSLKINERKYSLLLIIYWILFACRFIYTGSVDVNADIAQDLLRAADQYLLDGLKRLCEYAIAQV